MPRTRGVVARAPTRAPDVPPSRPAPPKRSGSLPTLPTPPRTRHKRKRARSRVTDSDSEDDELPVAKPYSEDEDGRALPEGTRDANGALVLGNKKRKTLEAIAEELSEAARLEDEFWMGESSRKGKDAGSSAQDGGADTETERQFRAEYRTRTRERTRSPSSSPRLAPHLLRRNHTGLASPPPSRRQPRTRARALPATPPPVPAAKPDPIKQRLFPTRDSPNNPFLSDGSPLDNATADVVAADLPELPSTPKPMVEKPTITYVFRGTRVELANPHYKSPTAHRGDGADSDGDAPGPSLLPTDHPDFSPPATYAPRLLFPEVRRRDLAKRRAAARASPAPRPVKALPSRAPASSAVSSSSTLREAAPGRSSSKPASTTGVTTTETTVAAASTSTSTKVPNSPVTRSQTRAAAAAKAHLEVIAEGPESADVETTGEGALVHRLTAQREVIAVAGGSGPRTRTRERGAPPRLPEKDRSDPARRAMGPVRAAGPPAQD